MKRWRKENVYLRFRKEKMNAIRGKSITKRRLHERINLNKGRLRQKRGGHHEASFR